jgi:hypothetical protein
MPMVVVRNGQVVALNYLVNKVSTTRDLIYRLFTNTITPADTDTVGSYTEASGGGYASKTLTGASWTVTGGAPTVASFAQQDWTFTGALTASATVRGYYATRVTDADLILAEAFTAFQPAANGDKILLTPRIEAGMA